MTDGGAKEWVTIKLPKEVRDDARDDPRTYGEIMRAGLAGETAPGADIHAAAEVDTDAIADAVAARGVSLDAAEHRAIAEEVVGMLR